MTIQGMGGAASGRSVMGVTGAVMMTLLRRSGSPSCWRARGQRGEQVRGDFGLLLWIAFQVIVKSEMENEGA